MSVLEGGVLQAFRVNTSDLVTLVWIGFFALTFLYQTRIQSYLALSEISRGLNKLKVMKDKARKDAIDYLVDVGKAPNDPSPRVDQFLDYVAIMPVDMDPAGIVGKALICATVSKSGA